jgi:fructose-specific phosphotransferase system IIC component
MRAAFLSSLANLGILIGGFVGGCLAKPIGQQKYQITFFMAVGGALLAGKYIKCNTKRYLLT